MHSIPLQCFTDDFEISNQVFLPSAQLRGYTEETAVVPDKHLDSSRTIKVNDSPEDQLQHQIDAGTISRPSKIAVLELNSEERETAISRYKEKRKTRRYCFTLSHTMTSLICIIKHELNTLNYLFNGSWVEPPDNRKTACVNRQATLIQLFWVFKNLASK